MKISLIQPSRNNLKYLKWSYNSIRKNQGDHEVQICVASDASTDGTWEWCLEIMDKDPNFSAICNFGDKRLGHTILYDKLVNEVAKHDICMIYHADMYLCPGALDSIEKHMFTSTLTGDAMYKSPKLKTIVSLTRIEPPLHPPGPEKILFDCGIEPEEFSEETLMSHLQTTSKDRLGKTTEGIFAPWAFWKKDFQEIGGHDPIFAPQSKEDTDIFNRFQLNGVKFIQTWEGCVYHMTCRGSRFADGAKRNPNGEVFMKNRETDEWLKQNQKSTREFLRKWGHFCKHDILMKPIIPPKYNIGIKVENCTSQLLESLEPWCDKIYTDLEEFVLYQIKEENNTSFNLNERLFGMENLSDYTNNGFFPTDIFIEINGNTFTNQDYSIIQQFSEIIQDSGEIGEFELGNLKITVNSLKKYENNLIKV
jgi:glycosyltransferase involved in cell wall biosynthesis